MGGQTYKKLELGLSWVSVLDNLKQNWNQHIFILIALLFCYTANMLLHIILADDGIWRV